MSVDQIRAALETIDATPRHGFLAELEHQLVAAWADDTDLDVDDVAVGVGEVAPHPRHPGRRATLAAAASIVVLAVGLLAVVAIDEPDSVSTDTGPPTAAPSITPAPLATSRPVDSTAAEVPSSAFSGSWWTSSDSDGSAQTLEIAIAADGSAQMTMHDDVASVLCAGAAGTVTGTGKVDSGGLLVITVSEVMCDDGSEPVVDGAGLGDYTLAHDEESDTLTDNLGVVWRREGADDPSPARTTSGTMWPQSSADEVREAQALADAGDPAYTWQVDPQLSSQEWWGHLRQPGAEIADRFLREELGWDEYLFNTHAPNSAADGVIRGVVYLRCAPGETNRLYPIAEQGDALGADRCAPTMDDLRYETVSLDLSQLDRQGREGIWVVSRWATAAAFTQADPRVVEADATARLEDFLRARIDGEGAEGYVDVGGNGTLEEVPLLYATTTGAPYERSELERVSEPLWPDGDMKFTVRLFADGGETVVEQRISVFDGRLFHDATETTVNGGPLAVPYVFFDGDVTLSAADPWVLSWRFALALTLGDQGEERVELVADSFPVGCTRGLAPVDASTLARQIQSDPDLQVTAPVRVDVGGIEALAMDITVAEGADVCEVSGGPGRGDLGQGSRMRLYLVDLPEGSATRTLAIAVVAPEARFEAVLEAAAPIIDSIEFHTDGG